MKIWMKMAVLVGAALLAIGSITFVAVQQIEKLSSESLASIDRASADHETVRNLALAYNSFGVAFTRLGAVKTPAQFDFRLNQVHEAEQRVGEYSDQLWQGTRNAKLAEFRMRYEELVKKTEEVIRVAQLTRAKDPAAEEQLTAGFEEAAQPLMDAAKAIDQTVTAKISAARANASTSITNTALAGAALATVILLFGAFLTWNIVGRIRKLTKVTDRLTDGDIQGLAVNVRGSDEIGKLGDSMERAVAAFTMLFEEVERSMMATATQPQRAFAEAAASSGNDVVPPPTHGGPSAEPGDGTVR